VEDKILLPVQSINRQRGKILALLDVKTATD
jgi:hypothetical protein